MSAHPQVVLTSDLLERAEEFYTAFKDLPERAPPSWPRYFLLCHAVELALKAYLAMHGKTMGNLKNEFGHNIERLLDEAVRAGLPLGPLARGEIPRLNEAHVKFWPRYPREKSKPIFVIEQFDAYTRELLCAVRKCIHGGPSSNAAPTPPASP